jgi:hypothetical protein
MSEITLFWLNQWFYTQICFISKSPVVEEINL